MIFSDDVSLLSPSDLALIRDTIALAREVDSGGARGTARSIDLLGDEFAAGVAGHTASGALVARVNASDDPRELELDLAAIGLPPTGLPPVALLGTPEPRSGERRAARASTSPPTRARCCGCTGTRSSPSSVTTTGPSPCRTSARHWRGATPASAATRSGSAFSSGEFTAWSYNMELLDGLPLSEEKLDAFLRTVEPDPGAHRLVAWCEENAVPFRILSDGFDRNLDRLQELHGVRFAYDANRLWYENGAWRIAPGHPNPDC